MATKLKAKQQEPKSLGINIQKPKYPQYAVMSKRLDSYKFWPDYLPIKPTILAEAGLVYTGSGDSVRCYHCGGGLRNWERGDRPWVAHAKWYPECGHINLVKGQKYVDNVLAGSIPESDGGEVEKGPDKKEEDPMKSIAVESCREMGFKEVVIKQAVDLYIMINGNSNFNGRDIATIAVKLEDTFNTAEASEYAMVPNGAEQGNDGVQIINAGFDTIFRWTIQLLEEKLQARPSTMSDNRSRPDRLARTAYRFRQNQRPADPREMDFELSTDHIPERFLQADITVNGARHIVFSTPHQLELLSRAKTWYLDGASNVIRSEDVFDQLFGVHAFIKKNDVIEQVPLAFVFMSRKRSKDYKKVLKKIKNAMAGEPRVQVFVLDFEAEVWKAISSVFPEARVRGCAFHWTQAVWRRIQACGLAPQYNAGGRTQTMLRRLLALPLLPAEHIAEVFSRLRAKADNAIEVFDYVRDTLIEGSVWNPFDWSVYGQHIRTENDCEGWHRRLNARTDSPPTFYAMVDILHEEAQFVVTHARLVSSKKLGKHQRKRTADRESSILKLWTRYSDDELSAWKLLKKLSKIYGI